MDFDQIKSLINICIRITIITLCIFTGYPLSSVFLSGSVICLVWGRPQYAEVCSEPSDTQKEAGGHNVSMGPLLSACWKTSLLQPLEFFSKRT